MELIRKLPRKPTAADKPVVRELSLDHALLQAKEINKKIKVERAVDEQQEIISKMRKLLKKLTVTNATLPLTTFMIWCLYPAPKTGSDECEHAQ